MRVVSAAPATWLGRLIAKLLGTFPIPDTPHLDQDALDYFYERLKATDLYLEYGSGGSTVLAKKLGKPFVSVETDILFLQVLQKKLAQIPNPNAALQTLLYRHIGITGAWGVPIFKKLQKKG